MGDCERARVKEDQFLSRLRENLGVEGTLTTSDCMVDLRRLTEGRLLRSELETKYPLGRTVSMRLNPKTRVFGRPGESILLTGRVVLRLDRLVERGADDEPLSMAELHNVLLAESDTARRNRCESVLGLFSPTGWDPEAKRFVLNDPPGSGWVAGEVHPILIGPEITDLLWDTKDSKLRQYVPRFCGLTIEERRRVCTDEMQRAIVVQEFANLEKIADARGFDLAFVKEVAKELCRQSRDLKLANVRGVGPVVKRTI